MGGVEGLWQTRNPLAWGLLPLAGLFCLVARARRWAYQREWLPSQALPVPVILVGNLTVGGTGKTPFVIWLARHLLAQGRRPGILTRGYRGRARTWPQWVTPDSDPRLVGDEPVLLARHSGCPVVAGPNRVADGRLLLARAPVDLMICDDGLQHYALRRDLELVALDGQRRYGNGWCLPAGPLREPVARLVHTDLQWVTGPGQPGELSVTLTGDTAVNLVNPDCRQSLEQFRGRSIIALAGIGNPERFFALLRRHGLEFAERPFPDHHAYQAEDLASKPGSLLMMTEKDAVKCAALSPPDAWYVPVQAAPEAALVARLDSLLAGLTHG